MKITLPRVFWLDHTERDLPSGELIRRSVASVVVEVTEDELREIESDARFYSDANGPDGCPRSIIESAKRTVAAIEKHRRG